MCVRKLQTVFTGVSDSFLGKIFHKKHLVYLFSVICAKKSGKRPEMTDCSIQRSHDFTASIGRLELARKRQKTPKVDRGLVISKSPAAKS